MPSFLSGHSSDGKLVWLLNDHHVSPTPSSPPSFSAAPERYPASSASTQAYIAPEMPLLPLPKLTSHQRCPFCLYPSLYCTRDAPTASTQAYIAPEMPMLQRLPHNLMQPTPQQSQQSLNAAAPACKAGKPKKKHVCPTCSRPFSTSDQPFQETRLFNRSRMPSLCILLNSRRRQIPSSLDS